ncbi:hypothetical protein TPA0906_34480 [Streptomyces olivaceus]|uniref:hypothetical protein n=1 Tax=Streptomyces olivaceus TaxID=47716 RepID=UPI0022EED26C|nr:hypothetical protein [Streptomyces olivaceus]GHJ01583.1 hypothetical protein TPA0906_34480 [Streptomyces olivaceus]
MTAPNSAPTAGGVATPPGRPVRFADPARNAAYWARIERNVAAAPPLTDEQRAVIRTAFSTVTTDTIKEAA